MPAAKKPKAKFKASKKETGVKRYTPVRKLYIGIAVAIVVLGAGSIRLLPNSHEARPLTPVTVRLEWLNGAEFTGMYVAKDKGFYKDQGLSVTLKEFQDGTEVNQEVATGTVDFGVSTPLEVILARDKGINNKAVAAIYQKSAYAIVAQKSANIKNPIDFKGKVLGNVGNNNEAKVTYAALLANVGIDPKDVTIKPVDFDIIKVFKDNQADTGDIYFTDQPYVLDQQHIDYDLIYPDQFGFAIYGDVLIASDNKIAKDPNQTAAFVKATVNGWQYAIDHQTEALQIMSHYENALYHDAGYEKHILGATAPLVRPTGNKPLGSMQFIPWNRAYQGAKASGLLTGNMNVSDIYTTQFVDQ
jgi:NitT/TauT family transport system substrate-binding protein